jgi:phage shock protein PspC (stress-responsive transcriptional regulator)
MKRWHRSKSERIIGGVCGGLGLYLDADPTVIRLVWVVLTCVSLGIGIVAYIVAWIIVPEEGSQPEDVTVHP